MKQSVVLIDEPAAKAPSEFRLVSPPRWLFVVAVLVSAFLLFQVQPLAGKAMLPLFGGTPQVWVTSMLVFQWLLLAGYLYAHLITRFLGYSAQAAGHVALLAFSVFGLPILPSAGLQTAMIDASTLGAVQVLLVTVGLPFATLSATGPLLQHWFYQLYPTRSAYRLYAASNIGSLLALVSYPFLFEPVLSLSRQSTIWSWLFVGFALLTGLVGGATAWRLRNSTTAPAPQTHAHSAADRPTMSRRAAWFGLALLPSVMLMASTNQVCVDFGAMPLLWVAPLALYLLSFILCFDSQRWYSASFYCLSFTAFAGFMAVMLVVNSSSLALQVSAFFGGLFMCAMLCHGELARRKPHASHLTQFYLIIALAGACGGFLVAVVAPLLFNQFFEVQLATAATLLVVIVVSLRGASRVRRNWRLYAIGGLAAATLVGVIYSVARSTPDVVYLKRNFYGVLSVSSRESVAGRPPSKSLNHGRTLHGAQVPTTLGRFVPTAYYNYRSGVGLLLRNRPPDSARHIGVIGMGVGTLAAYGRSGDVFRFYEIDPDVAQVAREQFSFLADSAAEVQVVVGDARISLQSESEDSTVAPFDILVIDAFSGDTVPVHLLTDEAMALYLQRIKDDGVLAFHISNRVINLRPVLAAHAQEYRLESCVVDTIGQELLTAASTWVLMARDARAFNSPTFAGCQRLAEEGAVLWTDDYSSIAVLLGQADFKIRFSPAQQESEARLEMGIGALEQLDLVRAESELRLASELDPQNARAWLYLGNTLRRDARPEEAIAAYEKAIECDPLISDIHNDLGILLAASDADRAERHSREAVELDPHSAQAVNSLGNLMVRRGQLAQARDYYKRALKIDPNLTAARENLSRLRQHKP